jgi:hypothetical protein
MPFYILLFFMGLNAANYGQQPTLAEGWFRFFYTVIGNEASDQKPVSFEVNSEMTDTNYSNNNNYDSISKNDYQKEE